MHIQHIFIFLSNTKWEGPCAKRQGKLPQRVHNISCTNVLPRTNQCMSCMKLNAQKITPIFINHVRKDGIPCRTPFYLSLSRKFRCRKTSEITLYNLDKAYKWWRPDVKEYEWLCMTKMLQAQQGLVTNNVLLTVLVKMKLLIRLCRKVLHVLYSLSHWHPGNQSTKVALCTAVKHDKSCLATEQRNWKWVYP